MSDSVVIVAGRGRTWRAQVEDDTVRACLVAGSDPASQLWRDTLWGSLAADRLRHVLSVVDLIALNERGLLRHVRPTVAPAILVLQNGYAVDWFPAPLAFTSIDALRTALLERLDTYGRG